MPPASIWLVVPTYDEATNIERFVAAVREELPAGSRVLIVDDSSPDGTGEIADRIAADSAGTDVPVEVIHRKVKQGLGPAYIQGFEYALDHGASHVISIDADFSHDPADLPRMIEVARGGADLVIGSRYVPGGGIARWGRLRRLVSRGGSIYARVWLGIPVQDLTGGFKCYRREVLEAIDLDAVGSLGYAFQVETTYRTAAAGFSIVEIPIVFTDRREGDSKMSRSILFEAIWRVPALRLKGAGGARAKRSRRTR